MAQSTTNKGRSTTKLKSATKVEFGSYGRGGKGLTGTRTTKSLNALAIKPGLKRGRKHSSNKLLGLKGKRGK